MSLPPSEPTKPSRSTATPAPGGADAKLAAIAGVVVGVLVFAGLAALLVIGLPGDDGDAATGRPPAAGPSAAGAKPDCEWLPESSGDNPNLRDVGTPPTDVPTSGAQLMKITTNSGVIEVEVATAKAPCAAASMTYLASKKFFDGSVCHRMTTEGIHVLQCGDPSATGMGGPSYKFAEENLPTDADPNNAYPVGTIAMAKTQAPASTGSQFFIVWGPTPLNGDYTVLGKITKGLDIVQKIGASPVVDPETKLETTADGKKVTDGTPKTAVKIESLTVTPATA